MSETSARLAIMDVVAQIVEAHTAYVLNVETDNRRPIDLALQQNPYLKVMIDFMGADQANLGANPITRHTGQIVIHVVTKVGSGTMQAAALRDLICPYFNLKNLGAVHCYAAERIRSARVGEWEHWPILINFWQHEVSA